MPEYDKNNYWEMLNRQNAIINREEQLKLKNSKVTVIGCGGIGGAAAEMLTRMGFCNLRIIDKDSFDISNVNRQIMSSQDTINHSKTKVTHEKLLSINPILKVEAYDQELRPDNVESLIQGSEVVIDALDNLLSRILTSRFTREFGISFIHGAVHGTMGQMSVFTSETPAYEELFKLPSAGEELTEEVVSEVLKLNREVPPVIGPVPNIIGCLQAFEAVKIITGKGRPIMAPKVMMFDLLKDEPFSVVRF